MWHFDMNYETCCKDTETESQPHKRKKEKRVCHYYPTSTSAAILLNASSVVLIIPSFAKPLPKMGMPDISTFQNTSIFVALALILLEDDDDKGISVSVLIPVTGPSVIFVCTTNCSGFTVTN
jgi:hypothetical protein